ncbi:hypothetical protein KSS87_003737 [Heliosperma pusillum]|nr:hypothetical protein KSS87_003737 [Heliosperma pusillum]
MMEMQQYSGMAINGALRSGVCVKEDASRTTIDDKLRWQSKWSMMLLRISMFCLRWRGESLLSDSALSVVDAWLSLLFSNLRLSVVQLKDNGACYHVASSAVQDLQEHEGICFYHMAMKMTSGFLFKVPRRYRCLLISVASRYATAIGLTYLGCACLRWRGESLFSDEEKPSKFNRRFAQRLMHFLDSLDDHGFSEEEMRLTIEYGMNCHVRSLLDSLCDGDLSSKSDDEAYDLFDWLNRESRKPNFSLLLNVEENTIVDLDEAFEPLSDDVVDDVVERFGIQPVLFHDNYELGEVSGTLDMDEVEKFAAYKVKPLSDTTTFEDVFSREEECVDFGETLLNSCDANPFDDVPCWDEHVDDSWEAQVDAIEAALNGSGSSSYLEFFELDLSQSELDDIEAAFMDEMTKSEDENHGDDTSKIMDLAICSPLFYPLPSLQPSLTHTYGSFEDLNLPPPAHFEKRNDVVGDWKDEKDYVKFIHFYHIAKFSWDDPSRVILVYSVPNVGRDLAPSPPYPLTSPKPRLEDAQ